MKIFQLICVSYCYLIACTALAQTHQHKPQQAQLPKYFSHEAMKMLGATVNTPLPDGSHLVSKTSKVIELDDGNTITLMSENKFSCGFPALESIARVTATGSILWEKTYFMRTIRPYLGCAPYGSTKQDREGNDVSVAAFQVNRNIAMGAYNQLYVMPDKQKFTFRFYGGIPETYPVILFDVVTGLPVNNSATRVWVIDTAEFRFLYKKLLNTVIKKYQIPVENIEGYEVKTLPWMYQELEREIFRLPVAKAANATRF